MKTPVVAVALTLSLLPVLSSAREQAALAQAEVSKISAVTESFAKAIREREWRAAAELYVDDAVLYPPGETAVKGRKSIEVCLAALPPMKDFKLRNTKVEGRDDLAYVQGTYTMTVDAPGKPAPVEETGYYLEIRRRQADGRWLIAVHMLSPH